jgi:hypothetical protein
MFLIGSRNGREKHTAPDAFGNKVNTKVPNKNRLAEAKNMSGKGSVFTRSDRSGPTMPKSAGIKIIVQWARGWPAWILCVCVGYLNSVGCTTDQGSSAGRSPAAECRVAHNSHPVASRGGGLICTDPNSCRSFREKHNLEDDGEGAHMSRMRDRLRLIVQMEDHGSGSSGEASAPIDHAPEIAKVLDGIVAIDPLGCMISDRFGDNRQWPSKVRNYYVHYVAASEEDTLRCEDGLAFALRSTGETSAVTIATSRPGAQVKYVPVLFAKSQDAETFSSPTTPACQKDVIIGRYCIWTSRNGKPSSPRDSKYWVIATDAGPFEIVETGD